MLVIYCFSVFTIRGLSIKKLLYACSIGSQIDTLYDNLYDWILRVNSNFDMASSFFGLNPVSPPIQDRLHTPSSEEPLGFG